MPRRPAIVTALLTAAALLGTGATPAAPREPPPVWKDPVGPPTEPAVWLRRLTGRFKVDGVLDTKPHPADSPDDASDLLEVKGRIDCKPVGASAGVQCVLGITWREQFDFYGNPISVPNLSPAMALYGLVPGRPGIDYLQVDNKGLAEGGAGANTGNRATFRVKCINTTSSITGGGTPNAAVLASDEGAAASTAGETMNPLSCQRVTRIHANPGDNSIDMWIDIGSKLDMSPQLTWMLTLRRIPQTEPAAR